MSPTWAPSHSRQSFGSERYLKRWCRGQTLILCLVRLNPVGFLAQDGIVTESYLSTRTPRNRLKTTGFVYRRAINVLFYLSTRHPLEISSATVLARWTRALRQRKQHVVYTQEQHSNRFVRRRFSHAVEMPPTRLPAGFDHHTMQSDVQPVHWQCPTVGCHPHFDNHSLASRLVYMENKAKPHGSCANQCCNYFAMANN